MCHAVGLFLGGTGLRFRHCCLDGSLVLALLSGLGFLAVLSVCIPPNRPCIAEQLACRIRSSSLPCLDYILLRGRGDYYLLGCLVFMGCFFLKVVHNNLGDGGKGGWGKGRVRGMLEKRVFFA